MQIFNINIKRQTLIKNGIILALIFLVLMVRGCFSFVDYSFNWDYLQYPSYWTSVFTDLALLELIRLLTIIMLQPVCEKHNKDLFYQRNRNELLMVLRGTDITMWTLWVDTIFNVNIRIDKWRNIVNKKLEKLNRKAKDKDRMLYYSKNEDDIHLKQYNKYCVKRSTYETYLSDDWINENINSTYIKHCPKVNPNVFDLPVTNGENINKYKMTGNTKATIATSLIIAAVMMMFINSFKNAFEYSGNNDLIMDIVINLIIDIILMGGQIISGWLDAIKIVEKEILLPYINRNNVLVEYIHYKDGAKAKDILLATDKAAKDATNEAFNIKI